MDLKQLEYFKTVVETGNISAAARQLHMSQPPLSNQIKLLEQELGCVLLERGARHINLTQAGEILYRKASALLDLSDFTLKELEAYKKGIAGTLRIGIVSSAGNIFLEKWLLPFHLENPSIQYEIFEANTYDLLDKLKTNSLDFAIIRTPYPKSNYNSIRLLEESIVAIGDKKFFQSDSNQEQITLSQLSKKPILLYRRWESIITNLLEEKQIEWEIFCKNDDARTTLLWVNKGLGIGIVPASAKEFANPDTTVVKEISDCTIKTAIEGVFHPEAYRSKTAEQFLSFIRL